MYFKNIFYICNTFIKIEIVYIDYMYYFGGVVKPYLLEFR